MPRAAHPCAAPGCPTLVHQGSYCTTHEETRRHTDPEQARFYRTARWKKLSKRIRTMRPVCEGCHVRPSKVTDHADGDYTNNADDNLQALCVDCNATKTAKQHRRKVG